MENANIITTISIILLSFIFLCNPSTAQPQPQPQPAIPPSPPPLAPALFVIGDSSVDSGTNNFLATFARADRPPYGRDFDTHQPTGRFSNGRIPVDFLGNQQNNSILLSLIDTLHEIYLTMTNVLKKISDFDS